MAAEDARMAADDVAGCPLEPAAATVNAPTPLVREPTDGTPDSEGTTGGPMRITSLFGGAVLAVGTEDVTVDGSHNGGFVTPVKRRMLEVLSSTDNVSNKRRCLKELLDE